jgi:ribosome biogenesis GTPase / thiamine phosphate phosphatase
MKETHLMKKSDRPAQKLDIDPDRQREGKEKSIRHKQVVAERKKFKRNQQPNGPRRRDWTPTDLDLAQLDAWDGNDYVAFERIMPLDESDRRRALERTAFVRTDSNELQAGVGEGITFAGDNASLQGQVIAIAGNFCRVAVRDVTLLCTVRGTLHAQETGFTNAVAIGDQVLVQQGRAGYGVVEQVLPRHSLLARPDVFYSHLQQVVVANADQLLIVTSWREPIIWFELIDRYLVAAARNRLPAVICINKIDLAESRAECERDLQPYRALGVPCVFTSAQTGEGIEELHSVMQGRTTVLAGLSGVGKSSLLSAVQPGLNLRIGVVSEHSGEGRHTTTQATSLRLDNETWVVDTPGIREFGLSGLTRSQLVTYFAEMAEAAVHCRFRNCTHLNEPGCAVRAAVASGTIARSRNHSYRLIYASLPA